MKNHFGIILMASFALTLSSCGNKNKPAQPQEETVLEADENMENGIVKMEESVVEDTARWKGKTYQYRIEREPAPNLPEVKDAESGTRYMDNTISLSIHCGDQQIFHRTFSKSDFKSYLDAGFQKNGILEGFVFDQAQPEGLRFATSVSYPASDLYIPLVVLVASDGSISISKDNIMDVESDGEGD